MQHEIGELVYQSTIETAVILEVLSRIQAISEELEMTLNETRGTRSLFTDQIPSLVDVKLSGIEVQLRDAREANRELLRLQRSFDKL